MTSESDPLDRSECAAADTADAVGWLVFRPHPPKLIGPHASFETAVKVAERLGNAYRIGYGRRAFGAPTFEPMEEPVE